MVYTLKRSVIKRNLRLADYVLRVKEIMLCVSPDAARNCNMDTNGTACIKANIYWVRPNYSENQNYIAL